MRALSFVLAVGLLCVALTCAADKGPFDGSGRQLAEFAAAYERARAAGNKSDPGETEDIGWFKGFVDGVFISHSWPCAPPGMSTDQVWAVVAKFVRENPERWNIRARDLVLEAATRAWGCKGETGQTTKKK